MKKELTGIYAKESYSHKICIITVEKFDRIFYIKYSSEDNNVESYMLDEIDTNRWRQSQNWCKIDEISALE